MKRCPADDAYQGHLAGESDSRPLCRERHERFDRLSASRMVEAAGIEPDADLLEKWRRRATFVVKSRKGKGLGSNSLSP